MQTFETPATREEGLRRLGEFLPRAGRDYAAERNFDRGPTERSNVSTLAPYVRTRLLTEEEILRAVCGRFGRASASKFIQEVFWRTYWKGWLEARPAVWHDYRESVATRLGELAGARERASAYEAAVTGRTGIDAFDAWARELTDTGYLHNHARMWFASIWIFTLSLPWELGADFFMRYLLCGDQASNTLSWRWVAGLHTVGKTYLARPSNIRRYTDGRFVVGDALAPKAPALAGPAYPPAELPELVLQPNVAGPVLLVLHDDDAGVDTLPLGPYDIRRSLGILGADGRSPQPLGAGAAAFARAALGDALTRAPHGEPALLSVSDVPAAIATIAERAAVVNASTVLAPFAPTGPVRDAFDAMRPALTERGLALVEIGRRYDALAWPHATRGFFGLRAQIPPILSALQIAHGDEA